MLEDQVLESEEEIEDDDDDDWIDDYDDELLGEDQWEDHPGYMKIKAAMPAGWYIVKCVDFNWRDLTEMRKWLSSNCRAAFKEVGFSTGCSSKVAVQFADSVDAVMFKLRWR